MIVDTYSDTYNEIHKTIHSNSTSLTIGGKEYSVKKAANGCRSIEFNNIKFMEQNKAKSSQYAERARQGEQITWGIKNGRWILIDKTGVHL
jgi:hypothetical protein